MLSYNMIRIYRSIGPLRTRFDLCDDCSFRKVAQVKGVVEAGPAGPNPLNWEKILKIIVFNMLLLILLELKVEDSNHNDVSFMTHLPQHIEVLDKIFCRSKPILDKRKLYWKGNAASRRLLFIASDLGWRQNSVSHLLIVISKCS